MLDQTQLAKVVDLLERRFGLDALLLFGSEARGAARADSDVDLAALFRSPPDVVALLEAGGRSAPRIPSARASACSSAPASSTLNWPTACGG